MIASLMMYARPETAEAHSRLWTGIRVQLVARGVCAPDALSQTAEEFEVWENPDLVLSQTCSLPYRTRLKDKVRLVSTPDYALSGCAPGYYRSAFIVRCDDKRCTLTDFATARFAYNMNHSHSGFAGPYSHTRALNFWFDHTVQSGAHLTSARMVAERRADIAAIDTQTWRLIRRYEPWAADLRVLEYTAPSPGLPFITGLNQDPEEIFSAVEDAVANLSAEDKDLLDLRGLVQIPKAAYLELPVPPKGA